MIKHQKLQMIWMNNDHTWSDTKDELSYKELSWHDIFKNLKKKNITNKIEWLPLSVLYVIYTYFRIYYKIFFVQIKSQFY